MPKKKIQAVPHLGGGRKCITTGKKKRGENESSKRSSGTPKCHKGKSPGVTRNRIKFKREKKRRLGSVLIKVHESRGVNWSWKGKGEAKKEEKKKRGPQQHKKTTAQTEGKRPRGHEKSSWIGKH